MSDRREANLLYWARNANESSRINLPNSFRSGAKSSTIHTDIKRELTLRQPAYPGKVVAPKGGCGHPGN